MAEGGFEVTNNSKKSNQLPRAERNQRPQTARGGGDDRGRGRGGRGRGEGRGGRGRGEGRGGAEGGDKPFRPNTGRQVTTNEDGEVVEGAKRGGDRKAFRGKDGDRKSGMGRGTFKPSYNRDNKDPKKEGEEGEEKKPKVEEEKKVEEPKQEMIEEVLGQSLEDFLKKRGGVKVAQGRQAEGIKGQKVGEATAVKDQSQKTVAKAVYGLETIATKTAETNKLFGFRGGDDNEFAGRGRGGQGRGGGAPKTGGRKGVKQALKKTESDFPTL